MDTSTLDAAPSDTASSSALTPLSTRGSVAISQDLLRESFRLTAQAVLDQLATVFPLACWALLRFDGADTQIVLAAHDSYYGLEPDSSHRWKDSLCAQMLAGAPPIAPDVSRESRYLATLARTGLRIGTYAGAPVLRPDGSVFATLVGLDPDPSTESVLAHRALLEQLAAVLTTALECELEQLRRARAAMLENWVPDPQGPPASAQEWAQFMKFEETAHAALGETAAVVLIELFDGRLHDPYRLEKHIYQATTLLRARLRDHDLVARIAPNQLAVILSSVSAQTLPTLMMRMSVGLNLHDLDHELVGEVRSPAVSLEGAQNKATRALAAKVRFR